MQDKGANSSGDFRVRPLEARDLQRASEWCSAATMHDLHGGPDPVDVIRDFFDAVISGKENAWIAEKADRLIGMAVVLIESDSLAHLKYLCVAPDVPDHQHVVRALAESAIRDAWEGGYLKLIVHTRFPGSRLIEYMHGLGFEFSRAHSLGSKRVVEFYRNLYERPRAFAGKAMTE